MIRKKIMRYTSANHDLVTYFVLNINLVWNWYQIISEFQSKWKKKRWENSSFHGLWGSKNRKDFFDVKTNAFELTDVLIHGKKQNLKIDQKLNSKQIFLFWILSSINSNYLSDKQCENFISSNCFCCFLNEFNLKFL